MNSFVKYCLNSSWKPSFMEFWLYTDRTPSSVYHEYGLEAYEYWFEQMALACPDEIYNTREVF